MIVKVLMVNQNNELVDENVLAQEMNQIFEKYGENRSNMKELDGFLKSGEDLEKDNMLREIMGS